MNAQQMLAALDRRFTSFKFEDYHHAFCHFLNLHIDSYASLEEFNFEFQTTVEDLRDYGHPLTNVQACSAYFSKLRCTQNPWVAKKLESWESQASTPKLEDLMKEAIPWKFKPATPHATPKLQAESIPEELVEDTSSQSDTDSSLSTASSHSKLHSRQTSNTTAITTHSLEITIHASSEDIAQITSLPRLPATRYNPADTPYALAPKKSMPLMAPLPPMNRPLPPIPKHILHTSPRARSASPRIMVPSPKTHISSPKTSAKSTTQPPPQPQTPSLRLETVHPTLRPRSPSLLDQKEYGTQPAAPSPITPTETKVHPALRVTPPLPSAFFGDQQQQQHEANAPVPWPCTPDRPTSARNSEQTQKMPELDALTRLRAMSGASSTTSLPLLSSGGRAVSPPRLQDRPLLRRDGSSPPLLSGAFAHSPPQTFTSRINSGDSLAPPSRTPTFESLGVPRAGELEREGVTGGTGIERSRSPVRELVARLSGESAGGEERKRGERKKSWSLGRFGAGKGVREIV